jgi:hypothetical protein
MYPGYIDVVPTEILRKIGNSYSVTVYTTDFAYLHIYILIKHFPMLNIYLIIIYFIYKFCLFEPLEEARATVELKQQHWELGGPLHHV